MNEAEVFFYLPERDRPTFTRLPNDEEMQAFPGMFKSPVISWVWRSWIHLKEAGFACRLVDRMPEVGIVVVASCILPLRYKPAPGQFIVECVADSPPRFYSQCQVFQSMTQATGMRTVSRFPHITFMPHWSQPRLRPREEGRGDVCVNVDYFGAKSQLAAELHGEDFAEKLRGGGLRWRTNFDAWGDYRTTDLVLGVRELGRPVINHKPGSKLLNAWRAGAPAILGPENGFRELRRSDLDYLEVDSVAACLSACERLRDDAKLRAAMVENGRRRAAEYSDERLTARWQTLLGETVPAWFERWRSLNAAERAVFCVERATVRYGVSLARRARKLVG